MSDVTNDINPKNVKSVNSGGEGVTVDSEAVKADSVSDQNNDLTNIANRLVDPRWRSLKTGRIPY